MTSETKGSTPSPLQNGSSAPDCMPRAAIALSLNNHHGIKAALNGHGNQEINASSAEINGFIDSSLPTEIFQKVEKEVRTKTALHDHLLLPPSDKKHEPIYRQIVRFTLYEAITQGKLTIAETVKQISELKWMSTKDKGSFASDELVAQIIRARLCDWQVDALNNAFSVEDIYKLDEIYIRGKLAGFKENDSKVSTLELIHLETKQIHPNFDLQYLSTRSTLSTLQMALYLKQKEETSAKDFETAANRLVKTDDWRGYTRLGTCVIRGHAYTIRSIKRYGRFSKQKWRQLIEQQEISPKTGLTPFSAAVMRGQVNVLAAMWEDGEYSFRELWVLLDTTLSSKNPETTLTPFQDAIMAGHIQVLDWIHIKGNLSNLTWNSLLRTQRIQIGYLKGMKLLHAAACFGYTGILQSMKFAFGYGAAQFGEAFIEPLVDPNYPPSPYLSKYVGATPLQLVILRGAKTDVIKMLKTMRAISNLTDEQWKDIISNSLGRGKFAKLTPLALVVSKNQTEIFEYLAADYEIEELREEINKPLGDGDSLLKIAIKMAVREEKTDMLVAIKTQCGFSEEEMDKLIRENTWPLSLAGQLHYAAWYGYTSILETMLAFGYNTNQFIDAFLEPLNCHNLPQSHYLLCDCVGATPLHIVIFNGSYDAITKKMLDAMRESSGLTKQQWRNILKNTRGKGDFAISTPLALAVKSLPNIFDYLTADYTPEEFKREISRPLGKGSLLQIALKERKDRIDDKKETLREDKILNIMQKKCGFTTGQEWNNFVQQCIPSEPAIISAGTNGMFSPAKASLIKPDKKKRNNDRLNHSSILR